MPGPKKPNKRYDVTPERFLEVWQTSASAKEVAKRLGMPHAIVLARASYYRGLNIPLKEMPRGKPALDVAKLTRLVRDINEKHGLPQPDPAPTPPPAPRRKRKLGVSPDRAAGVVKGLLDSIGRGDKPKDKGDK